MSCPPRDPPAAGTLSSEGPSLRIAVGPWYVQNLYQERFYGALGSVVCSLRKEIVIRDEWLHAHAGELDVLHFHWPEFAWRSVPGTWHRLRTLAGFWTYLRRARALGYRVWWTVHNLRPHEGGSLIDDLGMLILARQADLIICHSAWSKRRVQRRFLCAPDRVVHLEMPPSLDAPTGAAPSAESARAALGVPESATLFGCMGQIRAYKNLLTAARAVSALPQSADAYLVIAGPPHDVGLVRELEELAAGHPRLRVVARRLDDDAFTGLMQACDAVLLTYRSATNSSVLLDALAAGRPVVAARHPAFEEIATRAGDAVIFARAPTEACLADALQRFMARAPAALAAAQAFRPSSWTEAVKPLLERLSR